MRDTSFPNWHEGSSRWRPLSGGAKGAGGGGGSEMMQKSGTFNNLIAGLTLQGWLLYSSWS
jgi:hypothetical protein